MGNKGKHSMLSAVDFCFDVMKEKIDGKGEDSYFYSVLDQKAIFGAFDGCGGSGARRYESLQGKTGAYMASRVISGATKDWFESSDFGDNETPNTAKLREKMQEYLDICSSEGKTTSTIKGKMSKSFPTTAAIIACVPREDSISATCIWAGDSRCYLLDETGLKQLTDDDLSGLDPMENLTADGVMTNVISASSEICLHEKQIKITKPCLVFSATDGCFGYLPTPMEFEYLIVDTLVRSENAVEWETKMMDFLKETAGDDFTLCGASIGYRSFSQLRMRMKTRRDYLFAEYIREIGYKTQEEKKQLWRRYAPDYMAFLDAIQKPVKTTAENRDHSLETMSDSELPEEAIKSDRLEMRVNVPQESHQQEKQENNVNRGFQKPTDLD